MEKDLQNIWDEYTKHINPKDMDLQTLDRLLSAKFKRRINKIKLQSYVGFIMILVIPALIYSSFYKNVSNMTAYTIFGIFLIVGILWYLYQQFEFYKLAKSIDLVNDTIKTLEMKLINLQIFGTKLYGNKKAISYIVIIVPFMYLIVDKFSNESFTRQLIVYSLSILYIIFVFYWNKYKNIRFFKNQIHQLLEELKELGTN